MTDEDVPDLSKRARRERVSGQKTGRPENLRSPWAPGQSANPGGRPKTRPITQAILKNLAQQYGAGDRTRLEAMVANMITLAITKRSREAVDAFKIILSYTDGLPVQQVEVDVYDAARREAEARGLDPEKVISILESVRTQRVG